THGSRSERPKNTKNPATNRRVMSDTPPESPAESPVEPAEPADTRPPGPISVNRRENEMAWSGIQTFPKFPVCMTPDDLRTGKVGIVHFDAHADTSPDMRGALHGHGTPMRRLIESGAVPGKNFVQVGLRGYYPPPDTVTWMEEQQMRTHFMAEIRKDGFAKVL